MTSGALISTRGECCRDPGKCPWLPALARASNAAATLECLHALTPALPSPSSAARESTWHL